MGFGPCSFLCFGGNASGVLGCGSLVRVVDVSLPEKKTKRVPKNWVDAMGTDYILDLLVGAPLAPFCVVPHPTNRPFESSTTSFAQEPLTSLVRHTLFPHHQVVPRPYRLLHFLLSYVVFPRKVHVSVDWIAKAACLSGLVVRRGWFLPAMTKRKGVQAVKTGRD